MSSAPAEEGARKYDGTLLKLRQLHEKLCRLVAASRAKSFAQRLVLGPVTRTTTTKANTCGSYTANPRALSAATTLGRAMLSGDSFH